MSDHVRTLYKSIRVAPPEPFYTWFATIKSNVANTVTVEGTEIPTYLTDRQIEYINVVFESVRETLCTIVDATSVSQLRQILPKAMLVKSEQMLDELRYMISVGFLWREKKGLGFC